MLGMAVIDVVIHSIFLATGLTGNMFILIVHFLDWQRTHNHNPCNLIINSIGIFNVFLQTMVVFQEITYFMFKDFFLQEWVGNFFVAIETSLSLSSLWCSTCLCFYYCVKIINLSGTLFYKLKAKLPVIVPWLLVFSIVLSWCAGMPDYWDLYYDISFTTLNITGNITILMSPNYVSRCNCLFQMNIIVASVAFIIIVFTSGAIITSLCKHMIRMRQNNEGFGHARITSHLTAAKTVTLLLINYLVFYGAFTLLNTPISILDELTETICFIVVSSFPTINAIVLILGNRKLTNVLKKLLGMKSSVGNTEVTVTAY